MRELQRKAQIAVLNTRIAVLRHAMNCESGITDRWKRMARNQAELIRKRNSLLTTAELRKIERERGLA